MSDRTGKSDRMAPAEGRDERLKAALRANLQRRKAQARARAAGEDGGVDGQGDDPTGDRNNKSK